MSTKQDSRTLKEYVGDYVITFPTEMRVPNVKRDGIYTYVSWRNGARLTLKRGKPYSGFFPEYGDWFYEVTTSTGEFVAYAAADKLSDLKAESSHGSPKVKVQYHWLGTFRAATQQGAFHRMAKDLVIGLRSADRKHVLLVSSKRIVDSLLEIFEGELYLNERSNVAGNPALSFLIPADTNPAAFVTQLLSRDNGIIVKH